MKDSMEELKEFFIKNWQLIASGLLFIIATVISIIRMKKKGMTFQEIISGLLMEQLPLFVDMAENKGGTGEQKRVYVLNKALNFASSKVGRPLTQAESDMIISYVTEKVELILTTPQKKGAVKKVR